MHQQNNQRRRRLALKRAMTRIVALAAITLTIGEARAGGCDADLNGDETVGPGDLAIVLGSWGPVGLGPVDPPRLYSMAIFNNELAEVDMTDGTTISTVDVLVAGGLVHNGRGLAFNPVSGLLYAIVSVEDLGFDCPGTGDCFEANGTPGCDDPICCTLVCAIDPFCCESEWDAVCADLAKGACPPPGAAPPGPWAPTLITVDPANGVGTTIGILDDDFITIAFTTDGTLYGVTSESATDPESLYEIDPTDATSKHVLTLGIGDEGEAIAYRPVDGLLYHASGFGQQGTAEFLETIDLDTLEITNIELSGGDYQEMNAMTYDPVNDEFIVVDVPGGIYHMSPTGEISHDGFVDTWSKGLALVGDFAPSNPADLDGDGVVGPPDLAILLGNWGPCP